MPKYKIYNPPPITNINDPQIRNILTGQYYAIQATGGYIIEQNFDTIKIDPVQISKYDVTNAIQILYDVDIFNDKLGKYNEDTSKYENNDIILSADEFKKNIISEQVISLGKCSTLYSDFSSYVNGIFGYSQGFSTSIFSNTNNIPTTFDTSEFIHMINGKTFINGEYVYDLLGEIQLTNVSKLIDYVLKNDIFNNRNISENISMSDKFLPGDFIFIPGGIKITLKVNTKVNSAIPFILNMYGENNISNNLKPIYDYSSQSSIYSNYNDSTYTSNTTHTTSTMENITRTITAPILIKLVNIQ